MICEQASDSYRLKANPNTQTPTASTTRLKSANNSPSEFMILSDHAARGRADSLRSDLFVGMRLLISLSQSAVSPECRTQAIRVNSARNAFRK